MEYLITSVFLTLIIHFQSSFNEMNNCLQGTHLKNHRKVHTGERPFRCDICDVGFSDRFALKRHRNVHGAAGGGGGGGSSSNSNQGPDEPSGPSLVDLYKCEVGQVAFPGCQRPPEDDKPL